MSRDNELVISNSDLIKTDDPVKSEAICIAELEDDFKLMKSKLDERKEALKNQMIQMGLKQIVFQAGYKINLISRKNIKVDKKKAMIYLDSTGQTDNFLTLDEKKVKEVFNEPDMNKGFDFIVEDEPTVFVQISKEKK